MTSIHVQNLERLVRSSPSRNESGLKTALERLLGEIMARRVQSSADSADYFMAAAQALKKVKGISNPSIRKQCLCGCWAYFYHQGRLDMALDTATELERLASRSHDLPGVRLSHNFKGIVYSDLGNIAEATVQYSESIDIARRIGDVTAECAVTNNAGIALNYAGLYHDAIACFKRVLHLHRKDWEWRADMHAWSNLAQSYLSLGKLDQARKAIDECIGFWVKPASVEARTQQTIRESTFVWIALELGDYELAKQHAEVCRMHAYSTDSFRWRGIADIACALCEVRGGNVQEGLRVLERILDSSEQLDSHHSEALIAVAKAYDEAGQPEVALRHMERLMGRIREHRMSCVQTLLSLPAESLITRPVIGDDYDLQPLEHRFTSLRLKVTERELASSRIEMLERLAVTADLKEDSSGEHGYRVGRLAALLARELGWTADLAEGLDLAARLHDLGKTGIPDRVIGSSQALKEGERQLMSKHTVIGAELLAKSNVPQLKMAERIARYHHEWWDGSGYPDRLVGKHIPIHARIVALADVFDALTHGRPYASPWSIDHALEEIRARRGAQFDPDLTDRFLALVERLRFEHADLDTYLGQAGANSPFRQARNRIRDLLGRETERETEKPALLH
jgi:putative two-component system response regulator